MEAGTMTAPKVHYLKNVSKDTHVVADLNLTLPGKDENWGQKIISMSDEQFNNSMAIQTLLADGSIEELTYDEMRDELKNRNRPEYEEIGEDMGSMSGEEIYSGDGTDLVAEGGQVLPSDRDNDGESVVVEHDLNKVRSAKDERVGDLVEES